MLGSHFHEWIGYNGVAFSIEMLKWGRTFSGSFFARKLLASRDLNIGGFVEKNVVTVLVLLFYYLTIGSHYIPFLK